MSYDLYDTIVYELLQVLIFEHPKFTNIPSIFLFVSFFQLRIIFDDFFNNDT